MLSIRETYVSTDVEADGPIPGTYSMLSLGSVPMTGVESCSERSTESSSPYPALPRTATR